MLDLSKGRPISDYPELAERVAQACREMYLDIDTQSFVVLPDLERHGFYYDIQQVVVFCRGVFDERISDFIIRHEIAHAILDEWVTHQRDQIIDSIDHESLGIMPSRLLREVAPDVDEESLSTVPEKVREGAAIMRLVREITIDVFAGAYAAPEAVNQMVEFRMLSIPGYGENLREAVAQGRQILSSHKDDSKTRKALLRVHALKKAIQIVSGF